MQRMAADRSAVPNAELVADEGLARWVADMRQGGGQSCRDAGAERLRRASLTRAASRPGGPQLTLVEDLTAARGLRVRLYRPALRPRPLTLYLHGGGFVIGDLESHDAICRRLAHIADAAVLAVDYRRAPEHPGPVAVADAVSAGRWALHHLAQLGGDAAAGIALAGDSAGGALAVLAAASMRDRGDSVTAMLLAYPNADMTLSAPSVEQEGHGWGLEADDLRWFVEQWIPDPGRRADPLLSPLHARLAGLPPSIIATAGHDPLRDEGSALARQLMQVGSSVTHLHYPRLVHGFLGLDQVSPAAAEASREIIERFGSLLREQSSAQSR